MVGINGLFTDPFTFDPNFQQLGIQALKQPATKASTEESDADLWTLDAAHPSRRMVVCDLLRWNDEPRWWQVKYLCVIFILIWEMFQFDEHIFQVG